MKLNKKKEHPIRLDFNVYTRKIIEIYEISPDGSQVRTAEGWVSAYRDGVITMRGMPGRGFLTDDQVALAIQAEREMVREKKYEHTGAYLVAKKYPIREWLQNSMN